MTQPDSTETATLAGGCFWCIEAAFQQVEGVISAVSGYTGGPLPNPTYQQVCNDGTGHAEAVSITYDPGKISFQEVLEIFFSLHDPTTPDRQGADVGSQYRSAVFCHNEEQQRVAQQVVDRLSNSGAWKNPIVTQIVPLEQFYPAEEYHQDYFKRHPGQAYCQMVIQPKVEKMAGQWAGRMKAQP